MKAHTNYPKKALMWYKVTELWSKGLNKSQIARQTGLDRGTVRRYIKMDENMFHHWLEKRKNIPLKLAPYYSFVESQLKEYADLSAAQIEDRLKEHFPELPCVHSKTIYNFVRNIRKQQGILKSRIHKPRQYQKLPDVGYGKEAQVDFGIYNMQNGVGGRIKIWFFVMVLSRSRQKFVYMQNHPFTSSSAIYAHYLAFAYFQGVPHRILYDQDRVFMQDENLGDLLLTGEFKRYCEGESFQPVFCRKADPESKGKVENVVKYVKNNFLRGRTYDGNEQLNQQVLSWLKRTGNAKRHSTTWKIPQKEWEIERNHLLPQKKKGISPEKEHFMARKLRKDNTVTYRGNFYSVPVGTYKGPDSGVLLIIKEEKLQIYDEKHNLITEHTLSLLKGQYIRQTDHARDKSTNIKERQEKVLILLGNHEKAHLYLEHIRLTKPRYYHDNLRAILRGLQSSSSECIEAALDYCLENNLYNANNLCEVTRHFEKQQSIESHDLPSALQVPAKATIYPSRSNIDTYESLIDIA